MRLPIGSLEFDAESGELTGPGGAPRIAPQPASLLALLASRPGVVVTRDEIREHLWPGGKVEFEQGIAFAMREVRKAIEAAGGDPEVIETIPKRGFRLVVTPPLETQRAGAGPPPRGRWRGEPHFVWLAAGLALVVVMALLRNDESPGLSSTVVVFAHDVEGPEHAELARALGFELTTELTRALPGTLGVVGPTGTTSLSGPDDTDGARSAFRACLVVSGGIRGLGADSVVVFTQIVRTADRVHLWASSDTVPASSASRSVLPQVVASVESAVEGC